MTEKRYIKILRGQIRLTGRLYRETELSEACEDCREISEHTGLTCHIETCDSNGRPLIS